MALPKPTDTLGRGFRILTDDETVELYQNGFRFMGAITAPPEFLFNDSELTTMRNGSPLYTWDDGKLKMVAYTVGNPNLKAWLLQPVQAKRPSLLTRIKQFFKSLKPKTK